MKSSFKIFFVLTLFFSASARAKTLIVSDIDDTIKQSHVLNIGDAISRMFHSGKEMPFFGMAELYRELAKNKDIEFAYVSNAPDFLMYGVHWDFLRINRFPMGKIYMPGLTTRKDHKLRTIRNLVRLNKPDQIVLIGDNGEQDPEIYNRLRREFKNNNILVSVWIHRVYADQGDEVGSPVMPFQNFFVSPAEIAEGMVPIDLLPAETVTRFSEWLYNSNEVRRLPKWLKCQGYRVSNSQNIDLRLVGAVNERCGK